MTTNPGRPDNGHGPLTRSGIMPDEIGASFVPALRPEIAWVELDGEAVVMDEVTGSLHVLNPTGTVVLRCLDGEGTIEDLAADLASAFEASADVVLGDVLTLVRQLGEQGLLAGVVGEHEVPEGQEAEDGDG